MLVQVVLSNLGSVDEPHASVQFQLTPQPTGAAVTDHQDVGARRRRIGQPPAGIVQGEAGHQLPATVAVVLPAGQTDQTGTALSEVLQIAPST